MIFLNGSYGVGKSSTLDHLGDLLAEHGQAFSLMDVDWFHRSWPTAKDDPDNVMAEAERTRVLALANLCPDTSMSASLRTAIESGQDAGAFAIDLAASAKARGASVTDLKAGAVQPEQIPAPGKASADQGKTKTGAEQATGILALAASAGHRAVAHLKKTS